MGAAGQGGGYEIDQSILFNDDDSAYLEKTYSGSESTLTAWSFSTWVKRSKLAAEQFIFLAGTTSANLEYLRFTSGDKIEYKLLLSSSLDANYITSQLFRDPGAWMHIYVYRSSTTFKLYVDGSEVTDFGTSNAPGSSNGILGSNVRHRIGTSYSTPSNFLGTYLAEVNFIPGTAKAITDFGETNDDGVWIPKAYSGAYGTNGFYITGADSADLGADDSGNGNDFTSSGLTAADQTPDTPTSNSDSAIGNRATLMSIQDGSATMSEGNTRFSNSGGTRIQRTTNQPLVGKTYWEVLVNNATQNTAGVSSDQISKFTNDTFYNQTTLVAGFDNANFYYNGSFTTYSQPSATQRWMFAYDADTGELWSGVNGTWHNSGDPAAGTGEIATLSTSYKWFPFIGGKSGADQQIIWGASNMSHTVPTGFTADLSTYRQPDPTIADPSAYFQTSLWNGNSSTQTITQSGNSTFEPGMIWSKARDAAQEHVIFDQVRGTTKYIQPDNSGAEGTQSGVTAFNSDGFDLGSWAVANGSGQTHVGWQWKANGAGSSNEDGSINTTATSANTTAGFSVSTYTGTGSAATIGHGLGIAPKMIIVKKRVAGTDDAWVVWHASLPGANYYLNLNDTGAQDTSVNYWNNTLPTSSVFSVGASNGTNQNTKTFVAYCFAEIPGYSSISSYTGNGSTDGPTIYTGFKPSFVMTKRTNAAGDWKMWDNERGPYNVNGVTLAANSSGAESTGTAQESDFLSNGFKIRGSDTETNGSGSTYIYMAFAENPFGGEDIAPATAR